jgi:hypothetical protein
MYISEPANRQHIIEDECAPTGYIYEHNGDFVVSALHVGASERLDHPPYCVYIVSNQTSEMIPYIINSLIVPVLQRKLS